MVKENTENINIDNRTMRNNSVMAFYLCSFYHVQYIPFYIDKHEILQCSYTRR